MEAIAYPCFRVEQDRLGLWRWTYYHEEGRPLAMSFAGHSSERDCRRAIELMSHCGQAQTSLKEPGDTGRFFRPEVEIRPEPTRDPFHGGPKPWDY